MNRELTDQQVFEIKKHVYTCMDFLGKPLDTIRAYCSDEGIPFDENIEELVLHFVEMYPK